MKDWFLATAVAVIRAPICRVTGFVLTWKVPSLEPAGIVKVPDVVPGVPK